MWSVKAFAILSTAIIAYGEGSVAIDDRDKKLKLSKIVMKVE